MNKLWFCPKSRDENARKSMYIVGTYCVHTVGTDFLNKEP